MGWIGTAVYLVAPKWPQDFDFWITIGSDYSYEVKNSEIWVPAYSKHNNSFIATVRTDWLIAL